MYWLLTLLFGSALVITLVLYALRQNINLFFTPSQLLSKEVIHNTRIRIGGMVREGSILRNISSDSMNVKFVITDFEHEVTVQYSGVLPDLFREGQGVVALGKLDVNQIFRAEQILAKHDEKYMPPRSVNAT